MAGKIEIRQEDGKLVFYEGEDASPITTGHPLLSISTTKIEIGSSDNNGLAIGVGVNDGTRATFAAGSVWVCFTKNMATSGGSAGLHFDHAVGYQGETTLQATGIRGFTRILTGTTIKDGSPIYEGAAGYFTCASGATMDSGSAQIAGVRGCIVDGGTWTKVSHVSSIWADTQLNQTVSLGTYSLYRGTNNGDTELGSMINLWGTSGYFLIADGAGGGSAWESGQGSDAGSEAGHLLCKVGGQIRKIKLYGLA